MRRKTRQRVDFFLTGFLGVLVGAVAVLGILTVFEMTGSEYGFPRTRNVYIQGSNSFEDTVFSVIEKNRDSVVYVSSARPYLTIFGNLTGTSSGSGFILTEDGYIVTNQHVVSDTGKMLVTLYDGTVHEAEFVGSDNFNDIAVIKIDATGLDPVAAGDSDTVMQGELVFAMGSPYQLKNTITSGIVSAVGRDIELGNGFEVEDVIQTDAAINPGNSGGPLINSRGEVIGVNTAIISSSGGNEGVGFAVPINTVKRISDEIITYGKIIRPWFGIIGITIDERMSSFWNLTAKTGVLILDFDFHGNAKNSGLRETISTPEHDDFVMGDIITKVNDDDIDSMNDFINTLMKYKPGDKVAVEYYRAGEPHETEVLLDEKVDEK